jgi:NAD(P)-dependent dehydrogenase (short-subunit alcohol dehydrogenase family)
VGYATTQVIVSNSSKYHVIMACRNVSAGQEALDEIKGSSSMPAKGSLSLLQLDVADEASIAAAAKSVENDFGRLDVLINNAGIGSLVPGAHSKESLHYVFDTNVFGPILMIQAFESLLEKSTYSKGPYILQVSSGLGSFAMASDTKDPFYKTTFGSYRMTKATLNMATLQSHIQLSDKGFKVFAFCPGLVVSNLRGKTEEARGGWGMAGDPKLSGQGILNIIEGNRDDLVGKFVHKDGMYDW